MIRVNIAEAKAGLSRLLRLVQRGESVIICDRNVSIAQLRPISPAHRVGRTLGPDTPGFEIPAAFFETLSDDIQHTFEGYDR